MIQRRRSGASLGWNRRWYWSGSSLIVGRPPGPSETQSQAGSTQVHLVGWATVSFSSFSSVISTVALAVWLQGQGSHSCDFLGGGVGTLCLSVLGLPPLLLSCLHALALAADLAFIRRVESLQFAFHCLDNGCDVYITASHNMPIYGSSLIWSSIEEEEASSTFSGLEMVVCFLIFTATTFTCDLFLTWRVVQK